MSNQTQDKNSDEPRFSSQLNHKPGLEEDTTTEVDMKNQNTPIVEIEQEPSMTLTYSIHDSPPVTVTLLTALQHIVICFSGALSCSTVVANTACVPMDDPLRAKIFCTTIAMTGLATIVQTYAGVRLPIFQGASSSFLVPLIALQGYPEFSCDGPSGVGNTEMGVSEEGQYWRLRNMSGALVIAALVETACGLFGLLNILVRFIGPITVGVTITLIGTTLTKLPLIYGRASYSMTCVTAALIVITVLFLKDIGIPLPKCGKGPRKYFKIFQLLPILVCILVAWGGAAILTHEGYFPDERNVTAYYARADAKLAIIGRSPWFQLIYPGQYGWPIMNLPLTIGFTVAFISSILDSVGDYHAARQACQVPPPPDYAVSRGILIEGVCSLLSGLCGAGHATTSYSGNIAVLVFTKTASRSVLYVAGLALLVISFVGKAGAVCSAVPDPILGGVMMTLVGTLLSIGLGTLAEVDMTSSRNIVVVGVPIMAGITIPRILEVHKGLIDTGNVEADRIITVCLQTPMFLGGVLAMILDNTAPGSLASRGITSSPSHKDSGADLQASTRVYMWGGYPRLLKLLPWLSRLPFLAPSHAYRHLDRQTTQEEQLLQNINEPCTPEPQNESFLQAEQPEDARDTSQITSFRGITQNVSTFQTLQNSQSS